MSWPGVVNRYRDRLAIQGEAVTLHEGNTPLIPLPRLADRFLPGATLFAKFEGLNPTGSFKDRGMTAAVTQAVYEGTQALICASTGNTAASAAAYAARAGIRCVVLIPEGKVALGKLAGAIAYGAQVIQIRGSFDDGLRLVQEISQTMPLALVNSVNPARLEGQKTGAFEVVETLGWAPDIFALPVGNAGNISAYGIGFAEAFKRGDCAARPRYIGGQAWGASPLVLGAAVAHPETAATAIRIGNPARWHQAMQTVCESGGQIWRVTDDEIFTTYRALAELEGVFCEPSSAAGVAALIKSVKFGKLVVADQTIVSVLTGHGLKDPDSAVAGASAPLVVDATLTDLQRVLS